MSTGLDGVGGGREFFMSAHRCPEVDLLPHYNSETQIPPSCSLVPAEKNSCTGQAETHYLDISTICRSEEDGSISDWSEEDLSLHFSPSVILPSDDEESEESSFECVDITVETQVKGQEGEGLKMVPKRQIQLKKKKDAEIIDQDKTKKLQVTLKDGPAKGGGVNSEVSANELLCPNVCHRPDMLLRQHSMPASLHPHSTTSCDVNSYRFYKGLVAGSSQGFHVGGNSRQRLQKSLSLDETKTKMASCIIKSALSKKMQVEQNNSKTSYQQKKPVALPGLPQPTDQQRVGEGGGGKTGGGVFKAPVHAVRDMRSLVKNTYSLSFSTAPKTKQENNKPTSFKVIGQEDSPPPTYQQAVGVKGHNETKRSCQASVYNSSFGGHLSQVTASLNQSHDKNQSKRLSHPITQQRRGSEPIISRNKVNDITWPVMLLDPPTNSGVSSDLTVVSHSERAGGVSHQAGTSVPLSLSIQPPPPHPPHPASTSRHPQVTQPPLSTQEQGSILGVSSQFAPNYSQQIIHSCFYPPTVLPAYPPILHPYLRKVSYVHTPLSYHQTQLQQPPPAPTLHLLRRSEENQSGLTGNTKQPDCFIKTCLPHRTRPAGDQDSDGNIVTPATQQHEQQKLQQQQFLCSIQGFLPAQVGSEVLVDITASAAAPGALLSGPAPCHIMLDPRGGQCFYVDTLPQSQRKMLLDPETGQYIQVFLPAASSDPNNSIFPVRGANPTPIVINHAPMVLSVLQFQPTGTVSSLYAPPCLPFTLHTSSAP